jgi:hypothetical protein
LCLSWKLKGMVVRIEIQLFLAFLVAVGSVQAGPKHVMFAFVDHFEPIGSVEAINKQTDTWVYDYMAMAGRHTDADGRHPVHSYFLISMPAIESYNLHNVLTRLNQVTYNGYGEVEFHCHHGVWDESIRTEQDATTELINLISMAKKNFNMHGALITAQPLPKITFGFIHGMWALDNSRLNDWDENPHLEWCGVNRELDLLKQEGAYADYTFPAWGPMQPLNRNMIFYCTDDEFPASYKNPLNIFPVEVNKSPLDKLMIIQGPNSNPNISVVPGGFYDWPTLEKMDLWVNENVHVAGNDDWIFVKVHTHGLSGDLNNWFVRESFFGGIIDLFYRKIEQKYNDGVEWKLHYVSAREMYNIVKAAEAGKTGDPGDYRDYIIPPYANMVILTNNRYKLISYDINEVILEIIDNPVNVDISMKEYEEGAWLFESGDEKGSWEFSNARKDTGQFNELHFLDDTPSRFYCIIRQVIKPSSSL